MADEIFYDPSGIHGPPIDSCLVAPKPDEVAAIADKSLKQPILFAVPMAWIILVAPRTLHVKYNAR